MKGCGAGEGQCGSDVREIIVRCRLVTVVLECWATTLECGAATMESGVAVLDQRYCALEVRRCGDARRLTKLLGWRSRASCYASAMFLIHAFDFNKPDR